MHRNKQALPRLAVMADLPNTPRSLSIPSASLAITAAVLGGAGYGPLASIVAAGGILLALVALCTFLCPGVGPWTSTRKQKQ